MAINKRQTASKTRSVTTVPRFWKWNTVVLGDDATPGHFAGGVEKAS
jgi:hypothetical protein